MKLSQPDMIIIRMYIEEEGIHARIFAQFFFDEEGNIDNTGQLFTVDESDAYNQLSYDQIVLAEETEDGTGSFALCTALISEKTGDDFVACLQDINRLNLIVKELIRRYNSS